MNSSPESPRPDDDVWTRVGRAAEDFARRVARDAERFAERIQEHSSEFAADLSREWRRGESRVHRHRHRHDRHHAAPGDVRRMFEDVRVLVADVLDGIDGLIASVFPPAGGEADGAWEEVVSNREVACSACDGPIAVGEQAFVRRRESGVEYRCRGCGHGTRAQAEAGPDSPGPES